MKLAQVTVELRHLLETDFELFDFDYEFDDKKMAKELEQAVIDYFYFYEIGQETPEHFKHVFRRRWLSAISYYNKLHNTSLLEYNPLINQKMSEVLEELSTASRTENTESSTTVEDGTSFDSTTILDESSNTRTKASDYPQQPIAGGDYLSEETNTDSTTDSTNSNYGTTQGNTTTESTGELNSIDEQNKNYERTIEGLTGRTYQELIQLERENILRISQMLIEELKPCFILVH